MASLQNTVVRQARRAPSLAAAMVLFLVALAFALAGLAFDPRLITGAPAWLKPAKFAASTAIYVATIAGLLPYISAWPRLTRLLAHTIAAVLVVEDAVIFAQAWRGTSSHFNISTPLDSFLFSVMGVAIALLWLAGAGIAAALFRTPFADATWGWALRWGMALSVAGSALGGFMVQPTAGQLAVLRAGHNPGRVGAHTVGAADGGAGMPGVGWSVAAGDLRVPHFLGLHAVQLIPLAVWWRRRHPKAAVSPPWVHALAASYAALTAILVGQALRAEPLIHPGAATFTALSIWAVASLAALTLLAGNPTRSEAQA